MELGLGAKLVYLMRSASRAHRIIFLQAQPKVIWVGKKEIPKKAIYGLFCHSGRRGLRAITIAKKKNGFRRRFPIFRKKTITIEAKTTANSEKRENPTSETSIPTRSKYRKSASVSKFNESRSWTENVLITRLTINLEGTKDGGFEASNWWHFKFR